MYFLFRSRIKLSLESNKPSAYMSYDSTTLTLWILGKFCEWDKNSIQSKNVGTESMYVTDILYASK